MSADLLKEGYENIKHLLDDPKAFDAMVEKAYATVQKAKSGKFDVTELEKELNAAAGKSGKSIGRPEVEKMFAELNNDKVKSASKEELAKLMRKNFEEKKAQIEAAMKK